MICHELTEWYGQTKGTAFHMIVLDDILLHVLAAGIKVLNAHSNRCYLCSLLIEKHLTVFDAVILKAWGHGEE